MIEYVFHAHLRLAVGAAVLFALGLFLSLPGVNYRLEALAAPAVALLRFAVRLKPEQCTLVPERRQELTTEGGLDCIKQQKRLALITRRLVRAGAVVSAFIAPDPKQVRAASNAGCQAVELHTGAYANARSDTARLRTLDELRRARDAAWELGLTVHAGHGLTYRNIGPVAAIEGIQDFNIGHSIIARSLFTGLREATREMIRLIDMFSAGPLEL